ncbi:uncharacterized protein LOC109821524 [Asparagus officinalis]|uniref:uncharacterized protein LOC109821524 n=1 Tax=Asparagus officinalis TaxID=4686 RepID=UPI00098E46EF|nr:uncharacterized protein LOC109821524 [Asparagus officinalis]
MAKDGLKVDKNFKVLAYRRAAEEVNRKCLTEYTKEQVMNHVKCLKAKYFDMCTVMNMSGVGYDPETKIVTMDPDCFDRWTHDKKCNSSRLKEYLNTPLIHYDNLCCIAGDDQAKGDLTKDMTEKLGSKQHVLIADEEHVDLSDNEIGFGYMRQSMLCGFACGFNCGLGHLLVCCSFVYLSCLLVGLLVALVISWFVAALVCCGLGYLSTELFFSLFLSLFLMSSWLLLGVAGRGCAGDFILLAGHLLGVVGRGCAGDFMLLHHLLLCIVLVGLLVSLCFKLGCKWILLLEVTGLLLAGRGCAGDFILLAGHLLGVVGRGCAGDFMLLHHLLLCIVLVGLLAWSSVGLLQLCLFELLACGFACSLTSDLQRSELLPSCSDRLQLQQLPGRPIIPPSSEGIPSFSFVHSDLPKVEELFSNALVMKFYGGRPSLETSHKEILSWGIEHQFTIGPLNSRAFLLRFQDDKDLLKVLSRRSSTLITFPYRIFRWHNLYHITEDSCMAPVWISLPGPPLQCFVPEFLEAVANGIGRFLCLDKATATLARPSVARMCVEIDLRKPPPQFIWIGLYEGFEQPVVYERLPKYCNGCHVQGHASVECSKPQHVDHLVKPLMHSSKFGIDSLLTIGITPKAPKAKRISLCAWSPPKANTFALNVDGSCRQNQMAIGGVIRDHEGKLVCAFAGPKGVGTSFQGEIHALDVGVEFIEELQLNSSIAYTDSKSLAMSIGKDCPLWQLTRLWRDMNHRLRDIPVIHCVREANVVADALSKLGHEFSHIRYFFTDQELPIQIQKLLWLDKMGHQFCRVR